MKGTIFDIQHFCTGDGPGIRTTVFLKGCTLHCPWCHNPESQSFRPEILLSTTLCIGCGACDTVCPAGDAKGTLASAKTRRAVCDSAHLRDNGEGSSSEHLHSIPALCHACAGVCPSGCLEVAGKRVSVDEVLQEVLQDEAYYRHSGGGMTISGGEPMAQPTFSGELLEAARAAGLHTAVETSGDGRAEDFRAMAPMVNLWLWDIKMMDAGLYQKLTGGDLDRMLENLSIVTATGANVRFRVLYVPEIHDGPGIAEATATLLASYPQYESEVIPYHILGNAKREKLGLEERRFREPSSEETERFSRQIHIK